MLPYRAALVCLIGTVVLIGALLFFAYVTGWPAVPDSCIDKMKCYCEQFDIEAVKQGARGIRQPVNTWYNLYAIGTSGLIALVMGLDRAKGARGNVMKSDWWVADSYVFAALFLGLGSMWFHASISAAVSWMDGLSMYVFTTYLVFYTLDRGLARDGVSAGVRNALFRFAYPGAAVVLTVVGALGVDSLYIIIALVAAYLGLEFFYARFIFDGWAIFYWMTGVACMENAVLFWVLSQTGRPLCDPTSAFQPHGLLWHPLAGVMALMMYFYWRRENAASAAPTPSLVAATTGGDSLDVKAVPGAAQLPPAAAVALADIMTPPAKSSVLGRLLSGPGLSGFAARLGARLAARRGAPWRLGSTVIAARHADVNEALTRDLDFRIAPVNAARMDEVNGPFVLGMDRGVRLVDERAALYRALASVDVVPLKAAIDTAIALRTAGPNVDVVTGYARPIAAQTARIVFGLTATDPDTFAEVARAIFGHTFLNLGNDPVIRDRAVRAAALLRGWLGDEIQHRAALDPAKLPDDMMTALLQQGALDADGVRRTLGGMIVGSVDTTASTVAKLITMLARDAALMQAVVADIDSPTAMRGWCHEVLRRWPHNPILLREAQRDTKLGGTLVRAGDRIVVWTQAAMYDAAVFAEPERMRPDRAATGYLHFGGQLHSCAGRRINDFQVPMLITGLVRRGIASVGKIAWAGPFPANLSVTFR